MGNAQYCLHVMAYSHAVKYSSTKEHGRAGWLFSREKLSK
jgi:hypothetical protein